MAKKKKKVVKNIKYMVSKLTRERVLSSVFWSVILMRKNRNWETVNAWETWKNNKRELWTFNVLFGEDMKPTEREFINMSEKEGYLINTENNPSERARHIYSDLHKYFKDIVGFSKVPTNKKPKEV